MNKSAGVVKLTKGHQTLDDKRLISEYDLMEGSTVDVVTKPEKIITVGQRSSHCDVCCPFSTDLQES